MARKGNQRPQRTAQSEPLVLTKADGSAVFELEGEALEPLRHMVSLLVGTNTLPKSAAVVGALREEGVSHVALSLGLVLAHDLAMSVCVVDLNWWWPALRARIDGPEGPGVAEVILGTGSLDQALIPTSVPGLTVLPAGEMPVARRPIAARGAELPVLVHELSRRYERLIFDVPALLATSDGITLAALAECCLVVVRQGVTPSGTLRVALDDVAHLKMLGVVLNRTRIATPRLLRWLFPQV